MIIPHCPVGEPGPKGYPDADGVSTTARVEQTGYNKLTIHVTDSYSISLTYMRK